MSADALTRRVRSTSFGLVAWEAAIALCLAEAVTTTILGRTQIYQATLGWVLVATSVAAVTLVWLLSFWARSYPFLRSHSSTTTHSIMLVQAPFLIVALTVDSMARMSDYWYHYFVTLLYPMPAVVMILSILVTAIGQEVLLQNRFQLTRSAVRAGLASSQRWTISISLLLLGFLQGSSYLWVIGNDFTRYWAVADAIGSMAGYPASQHMPVYIAAGMQPQSIELPFFPLLLLLSFWTFGHDTVGAHMPGLLANTLIPLLLYALYKRVGLGKPMAFAAACTVAVIPFLRLYTLNAPVPDAVFEALLVGTGYLFLRLIGDGDHQPEIHLPPSAKPWLVWLLFGVAAALATLTRPEGLLFVAILFAALAPNVFSGRFYLAATMFLVPLLPFSLVMLSSFGLIWPHNQGSSSSLENMAKNLDWLGRYSAYWYAEPLGLSRNGIGLLAGVLISVAALGTLWLVTRRWQMAALPAAALLHIALVFTIDPRASGADQWFDFFRHISYGIPFIIISIVCPAKEILNGVQVRWCTAWRWRSFRLNLVAMFALLILLLSAYELRLLAFPSASYVGVGRQFLTSDVWVSLPDILANRYSLPEMSFARRDRFLMIDADSRYMAHYSHYIASHFAPLSSLSTGRGPGYQLASLLVVVFGALFTFATSQSKPRRQSLPTRPIESSITTI